MRPARFHMQTKKQKRLYVHAHTLHPKTDVYYFLLYLLHGNNSLPKRRIDILRPEPRCAA